MTLNILWTGYALNQIESDVLDTNMGALPQCINGAWGRRSTVTVKLNIILTQVIQMYCQVRTTSAQYLALPSRHSCVSTDSKVHNSREQRLLC